MCKGRHSSFSIVTTVGCTTEFLFPTDAWDPQCTVYHYQHYTGAPLGESGAATKMKETRRCTGSEAHEGRNCNEGGTVQLSCVRCSIELRCTLSSEETVSQDLSL